MELGKKMVVTAIATQGYGDPAVPEWMKQYMVMYSNGGDYSYFQDLEGNLQVSEVIKGKSYIFIYYNTDLHSLLDLGGISNEWNASIS